MRRCAQKLAARIGRQARKERRCAVNGLTQVVDAADGAVCVMLHRHQVFRRPWRIAAPATAGGQLTAGRDAGARGIGRRPRRTDTVARWCPRCRQLRTELQTRGCSDNRTSGRRTTAWRQRERTIEHVSRSVWTPERPKLRQDREQAVKQERQQARGCAGHYDNDQLRSGGRGRPHRTCRSVSGWKKADWPALRAATACVEKIEAGRTPGPQERPQAAVARTASEIPNDQAPSRGTGRRIRNPRSRATGGRRRQSRSLRRVTTVHDETRP